jgi:hypothetical protein
MSDLPIQETKHYLMHVSPSQLNLNHIPNGLRVLKSVGQSVKKIMVAKNGVGMAEGTLATE